MFVAARRTLCALVGALRFARFAPLFPIGPTRRGPRFLDGQWRVEIGIGLGDDLLAQFRAQLGGFDLSDRSVLDVSEVERTESDTDQPVHLQA
jgi:hypothetical protein